ncbi:MAG: peptidylprolyl isomerase [Polyangiales bacterium]
MKRVSLVAIVLGLLSSSLVLPTTTPAQGADAAETARRAQVYARIGQRTVTVGDLEDFVAAQSPYQRQRYVEDPSKLRDVAARFVEAELLATEARRLGLDRERTIADHVKQDIVQLLVRKEFDERITPEGISDAEIAAYYQAHPDEFTRPEMVRASHIQVRTEEEARALLEQARTADAAAFRQLARDRSVDSETKLSGGDLRYFMRDGRPYGSPDRPVEAVLVEAAFALHDVGDVAPQPIRVGENWSILKLTGRRPAETTPLAAASESIRRRLWREKRQEAVEAFVGSLQQRFPVVTHPELTRLIVLEPSSGLPAPHRHGPPDEPQAGLRPSPTAMDSH